MSGFTHRVTNQIRGTPVESAEARQLVERGWVSDPLWLLRTLHEFAHVSLNFAPVGEALTLAELALDRSLYDSLLKGDGELTGGDADILVANRDSLSLVYDLLEPWSEAVALTTEWDLDLTVDRPIESNEWMAALVGHETYDQRLWQARLSPLGVGKKTNTLVSSYLRSGHLLGELLSRIPMTLGNWRIEDIYGEIYRAIFVNVDLAHAILDLAEGDQSAIAANSRRENVIKAVAAAVEVLITELSDGPFDEYSARLTAGGDGLVQRMQQLASKFTKPFKFKPTLENLDLRGAERAIANMSYSLRSLVGLGVAPVDFKINGTRVSCVADGAEIYSFDTKVNLKGSRHGTIERSFCAHCGPGTKGIRVLSDKGTILHTFSDDPHIETAFRRARIASEAIESGQSFADLITGAMGANADRAADAASSRRVAAEFVQAVVEEIAGASFNLDSLRSCGVGEALDRNLDRVKVLARLSNETSATWTRSGRAALPGGPTVTDAQQTELNTSLRKATGLPLVTRTHPIKVVVW
jgi:hypothetical protein